MWFLLIAAGLAVEVAAIVALGRTATRRDEERSGFPAAVDETPATLLARGYLDRPATDDGPHPERPSAGEPRVVRAIPEPRAGS